MNIEEKQIKREQRKEALQRKKARKKEELKRMSDMIMHLYFMINEHFRDDNNNDNNI